MAKVFACCCRELPPHLTRLYPRILQIASALKVPRALADTHAVCASAAHTVQLAGVPRLPQLPLVQGAGGKDAPPSQPSVHGGEGRRAVSSLCHVPSCAAACCMQLAACAA